MSVAILPHVTHQVLIVDDDDDTREAVTLYLQTLGFDTASGWGVEDAYRQLRAGFRPCVVLLDLHMPGIGGWNFLNRMGDEPHLADVPAVVVSGDDNERYRVTRAGYDFLLKPVHPRDLIAAIARHCRRTRHE